MANVATTGSQRGVGAGCQCSACRAIPKVLTAKAKGRGRGALNGGLANTQQTDLPLSICFLLFQFYIYLLFSVKSPVLFYDTFNNNNSHLALHYSNYSELFSKPSDYILFFQFSDEKAIKETSCALLKIES